MRAWIFAFALTLGVGSAAAETASPFLKPKSAGPQIVKILAPPEFIDRAVVEALQKSGGATVALDDYASPAEFAERSAEQKYDVVILRGPALARRIAANGLAKLEPSRLPNARLIQPLVATKLTAYDRAGAYSVPFGWSAFGLIYDADKAETAFGGAPVSWTQALGVNKGAGKGGACDVVWPDARDESFLAVWKMIGLDPARAKPAEIKYAAGVLDRARGVALAFAAPDEVGAFAKGAACLGAGTAGEAAAAVTRGGDNAPQVRFAYPREGAPLALYAFAIPADAPSLDAAYRLVDALLAPDAARQDAARAGVNSAEEAVDLDVLKRLTAEPVLDSAITAAMQAEWKKLTAAK